MPAQVTHTQTHKMHVRRSNRRKTADLRSLCACTAGHIVKAYSTNALTLQIIRISYRNINICLFLRMKRNASNGSK